MEVRKHLKQLQRRGSCTSHGEFRVAAAVQKCSCLGGSEQQLQRCWEEVVASVLSWQQQQLQRQAIKKLQHAVGHDCDSSSWISGGCHPYSSTSSRLEDKWVGATGRWWFCSVYELFNAAIAAAAAATAAAITAAAIAAIAAVVVAAAAATAAAATATCRGGGTVAAAGCCLKAAALFLLRWQQATVSASSNVLMAVRLIEQAV